MNSKVGIGIGILAIIIIVGIGYGMLSSEQEDSIVNVDIPNDVSVDETQGNQFTVELSDTVTAIGP